MVAVFSGLAHASGACIALAASDYLSVGHRGMLLAQINGQGQVELDPVTRGRLLLALLAIALLGVGLIVMIILGARMVRRRSRLPPFEMHETPLPPKRNLRTQAATDEDTAEQERDRSDPP